MNTSIIYDSVNGDTGGLAKAMEAALAGRARA
jgi:hypothetical protein